MDQTELVVQKRNTHKCGQTCKPDTAMMLLSAILLAVCLLLALSGCGGGKAEGGSVQAGEPSGAEPAGIPIVFREN